VRIGVVNDSILAREALKRVIEASEDHDVAWTAADGFRAIELARSDRPDLILMDLIMPGINGVETTRRITAETNCPILIVTATVRKTVGMVYEAMGYGALDAVDTPVLGARGEIDGARPLLTKIDTIARLVGASLKGSASRHLLESQSFDEGFEATNEAFDFDFVLIGASTGGPNAIATILERFPRDWRGCTVVVQHVDLAFAPGLARWLADRSGREVKLIERGDLPRAGATLLAGTNDHLVVTSSGRFAYETEPQSVYYRPSVDVFFASAAASRMKPGAAAILTGMGADGARGLLELKKKGWRTFAQNKESSIIWGMPRAATELGAAETVASLEEIAAAIVAGFSR
jgi:two-component system response regulator WspF